MITRTLDSATKPDFRFLNHSNILNTPMQHKYIPKQEKLAITKKKLQYTCKSLKQLRPKHRRIPLPRLILLSAAKPLIILPLRQWHPRHPRQQQIRKHGAHRTHHRAHRRTPVKLCTHPTRQPSTQPSDHSTPNPQRRLTGVVWMPTERPQARVEEVLAVLLGALVGGPGGFLAVGGDLEEEAAGPEG